MTQLAGLKPSMLPVVGTLVRQYGMKLGLREFGNQGDDAVNAKRRQPHELEVMRSNPPSSLRSSDRHDALNYLMFLKHKRDWCVKGRGCADGRKQKKDAVKGDASFLTIATESVFLLQRIAAKRCPDVMTMDIPGAFPHTYFKCEHVHARFEGRMAEMLAMIDPKLYQSHVFV